MKLSRDLQSEEFQLDDLFSRVRKQNKRILFQTYPQSSCDHERATFLIEDDIFCLFCQEPDFNK